MSAPALPEVPPLLERPPVDWERHRGDKRPKILPPPGETWRNPGTGRKVGHRYYTRVTTFADALTEQYNLTNWKLAKLLVGLGQRSDYVRQASALTMEERDRDARDELVAKALEAAGPDAAGLGTALHTLTERLDRGDDIGTPPEEVLPDLAAYTALVDGLIAYRHREARVVCDQLECAGTPDGIAHVAEPCPAGCGPEVLHVIDTKTGSIRYPGKMSTQLAIYAHSDLYDPATGERTPIEVCRSWGAIIHLPTETGEAAPFWLDLEHGWRGAMLAGPVREWRKVGADDILRPFASVAPVRVVDGEVTRIEPRLASTNIKAPPAPEVGDVTELLAESFAVAGVALDDPETMRDEQLDGEPADEPEVAEPHPVAVRCPVLESETNPGAPRCERVAGHDGGHSFHVYGPPVERCVHELRLGECAMPSCRPDLAHLDDSGVERDDGPTEIPADAWGSQHETPIDWPGVDDATIEQLASGPDSSAEDEPEVAPLVLEILGCVTPREVEALSSRRWRDWSQEHRDLAVQRHDQLEAERAAAKPRAAFEAALTEARTVADVEAAVEAATGQPWLDDRLLDLAGRRWRELRTGSTR